jgi:hypothetical protein
MDIILYLIRILLSQWLVRDSSPTCLAMHTFASAFAKSYALLRR